MEAGEILCFNTSRKLVVQYKRFLDLLAELQAEKESNQGKLIKALTEVEDRLVAQGIPVSILEHLNQSDWFDDDKHQRIRKQVLDLGNDLRREIDIEFRKYTISL